MTKTLSKPIHSESAPNELTEQDCGLILGPTEEKKHIVRKTFRIPLAEGMVDVMANGKKFSAVDLSMYGVGIALSSADEFHIGQVVQDVLIVFSDDKSFLVDTKVIHVSLREEEQVVCGMQIITTHDNGYVGWMTQVISQMKSQVLSVLSQP